MLTDLKIIIKKCPVLLNETFFYGVQVTGSKYSNVQKTRSFSVVFWLFSAFWILISNSIATLNQAQVVHLWVKVFPPTPIADSSF